MDNQSPPSKQVRAHVFVSGTVHGVGFRLATWDKANQWGIGGWVEEIPDGRVEAVFEGSKEIVEAVVRWCYRGSPEAVVKNVTVEYEEPEGLKEFIIRRGNKLRVSQKSVSADTKTINVLIFIHGLMLEDDSQSEPTQYDKLWEPVKKFYNLSERIDRVVRVNWSQSLAQTDELRIDEKINLAHRFVAEQTNPERLLQPPNPNNIGNRDLESDKIRQPWWHFFVQPLRQTLLLNGLSDSIYYGSENNRIAVQIAAYSQILQVLEKYRPVIDKDLKKEEQALKLRLHIVSQSLGATIANDFLYGLFSALGYRIKNNPEQAKEPIIITREFLQIEQKETVERYQFWRHAAQKKRLEVGSVVSMDSQLPIFLLRSQRVIDTFAKGETLLADEIGIPNDTREIIWKIFYNLDDLLAFPMRNLFGQHPGIQDIQINGSDTYNNSTSLWSNETIHEHVAELLNRRVIS